MNYRKPKLKQDKHMWLDLTTHTKLRQLKPRLKQSMMQIVKNLVNKEHARVFQDSNKDSKK